MGEREELENWVVHQVIRQTHSRFLRISDSAQRELHLIVRRHITELEESGHTISKEARDTLVRDIVAKLKEYAPESLTLKKIIRRSLLERIFDWLDSRFSEVWHEN